MQDRCKVQRAALALDVHARVYFKYTSLSIFIQKALQLFLLNLAAACRLDKMEFNPYFNL
jgi:hypothetical protein